MGIIAVLFSDLWPYLAGAVAILGGLWGWGAKKKSEGRKQAETKAKEADYENATDIRNRVDRDLPERVRKLDDAGYRDE